MTIERCLVKYRNNRVRNRREMFEDQKGKCCYCDNPMVITSDSVNSHRFYNNNKRAATFEHLHTKRTGGSDEFRNIRLACRECNIERPKEVDWMTYKSYRMGEITAQEMRILSNLTKIHLDKSTSKSRLDNLTKLANSIIKNNPVFAGET